MIRVRVVAEFEIDPATYVAAGIEAEWLIDGELDLTNLDDVARTATSYIDADDHLPRWARDAMKVTSQTVEIYE